MIQENELRVGNYLYDGVGGIIKVEVDDLYDNVRKYYEPIELTEEILLKCGFKHKGNGFYEILGYFIELCNIGNEFYNCGFKGKTIGNIKYLHQLQNLYWCLCGKELNVQL